MKESKNYKKKENRPKFFSIPKMSLNFGSLNFLTFAATWKLSRSRATSV